MVIYGIYGRLVLDYNFGLSTQVPNTIQIITNNESRKLRRIKILGFDYIFYKSRCKMTKNNYKAYTLLEFLNGLDVKYYDDIGKYKTEEYIKKEKISKKDIMAIIKYFSSKVCKNLVLTKLLNVAL